MAEISLDALDVHDTNDWMIAIDGVYSYCNRKPALVSNIFNYISTAEYNDIKMKLYNKARMEEPLIMSSENRYVELVPSVMVDRFNSLEIMGVMKYDKAYTGAYSLLDKLDVCLACVFDEDIEVVRSRLADRCRKFGIKYSDLSFAVMTADMQLLQNVNMQVFLNLTDMLNDCINKLFISPDSFVYAQGDHLISLASQLHTAESRIATFIIHRVLFFAQLLLNMIILQFKEGNSPFECTAKCMLLSKGSYNIVFTAKDSDFPDIRFSYKGNKILLKPETFYTLGE